MMLLDLEKLEQCLKLMAKYGCEELQCNEFTAKRPPPTKVRKPYTRKAKAPTPQEILDKHMEPLPNEPWNSVSDKDMEAWDRGQH